MTESCTFTGDHDPRRALPLPAGFFRMCLVAAVALLLSLVAGWADQREDEYLRIYENIQQADALDAEGKTSAALAKYQQAYADLFKFRKAYPTWNKDMVMFRLNYAAGKAEACNEKLNAAAEAASPPPAAAQGQGAAKQAPTADQPLVKLLEPGAEPRKALRYQPKAGDKQTVVVTLRTAMEMKMGEGQSQAMKMPPVIMTMEGTIKDVAAEEGDISYETVIADASLGDEPGAMPQVLEAMKASLGGVKGLTVSGVMSSRGFNKRSETRAPETKEMLPANARLFSSQLTQGLTVMTCPLPEEPVGVGGKWEVKTTEQASKVIQKAVYEIVSIEGERVVAKAAVSQSFAAGGTTAGKGEGKGELTLDLKRSAPVAGNLTQRMTGLEGGAGAKQSMTMNMEMHLQIESK